MTKNNEKILKASYEEEVTNPDSRGPIFENLDDLVWLKTEDAARYLRTTKEALWTAVHRGQLPKRKWRRRLYFKRSELDLLLDRSQRMGGF